MLDTSSLGSWLACFYRWNCEEHNNKLLFAQHRVADKGVRKTSQAAAALLDEMTVSSDMVAVDGHSFGREQRELAERIAFV
jgi:hypothetical protein